MVQRSIFPRGDNPNEPFSTSAGGKDVAYQEENNADRTPIPKVANRVMQISSPCVWKLMFPETSFMHSGLFWKRRISRVAPARATTDQNTFSRIIPKRRLAVVLPITLRVLMLRMRTGVCASEKLVKLSRPIIRIKIEAACST